MQQLLPYFLKPKNQKNVTLKTVQLSVKMLIFLDSIPVFVIEYKSSDEVVRILTVMALKKDQWFSKKKN